MKSLSLTSTSLSRCATWWIVLAAAVSIFSVSPFSASADGPQLTTIHAFDGSDGSTPMCSLIEGQDGYLYGTTAEQGTTGFGTVFKISPSGALTTIHSFSASEGHFPETGLYQANDGSFYGTTTRGGTYDHGTVFKMSPDGTIIFSHSFQGRPDGDIPNTALVRGPDGNLYGTTANGGPSNAGTIYQVTPTGTVNIVYNFLGTTDGFGPTGLTLGADGNFYGTAQSSLDGLLNSGTVFQMTPSFTVTPIHVFSGLADEGDPLGGVVQARNGLLYGTAHGGTDAFSLNYPDFLGSVFSVSTTGIFNTLYPFLGTTDGQGLWAGVIIGEDGNFYGSTVGGTLGGSTTDLFGTIFQLTLAGNLTTLYTFTGGADGGGPFYNLLLASDGNFYGVSNIGGTGFGTVFRFSNAEQPILLQVNTPSNANFGQAFSFQVNAVDQSNNIVSGYNGVVHFTSSDPSATLPADATLTNGTGSFAVTLNSPGSQTITAIDNHIASISGTSNTIEVTAQAMHMFSAGLQMFSAPADFSGFSLGQIFSPSNVTLAVWQQSADQYALSPNPPADTLRPGVGYWARFVSSTSLFDIGQHTNENSPFSISLSAGWNMIGDPLEVAVPISDIHISSGGSTMSFSNAAQAGIVGANIYTFPADATNYQLEQNLLQPFAGYWVFADKPCTFIIPAF